MPRAEPASGLQPSDRPGLVERLGYGAGDLGINLYYQTALTYLLFFYTDVFGLEAGVAGAVILAARIGDALFAPLVGGLADRTRSRWGRLRPWLLFGAPAVAVLAVATFSSPALPAGGHVLYALATCVLFHLAYTVVVVPYGALTAALSNDAADRTALTTTRMFFAMTGAGIVYVGTLPMVELFGGGSVGFRATLIAFALAATVALWITVGTTRERARRDETLPSPRALLAMLRSNRPLWTVLGLFLLAELAITLRQGAIVYYLKYNLGREDLVPVFFAAAAPAVLLGVALVPHLARRLGKSGGLGVAGAITIVGAIGVFFAPYDRIGVVLAFFLLANFGAAPIGALNWSMLPDTVEYGEWKTGVRAEASVYALVSVGQKIAMAAGAALTGAVLAMSGYAPNAEQSGPALRGILWLVTLLPGAAVALLMLVARRYDLDANRHAEIAAALSERDTDDEPGTRG